jgi:hypothetical protein
MKPSIIDVVQRYGFMPAKPIIEAQHFSEWQHPSVRNAKDRQCSVMVFGNRAVVHCAKGDPHYTTSASDVEFMLRTEFPMFMAQPAVLQAANA